MKFVELSAQEFNEFASKHPQASFSQSVEAAKLRNLGGDKTYFVGVKENEEVIAASLVIYQGLISKYGRLYAPRGYLLDYTNIELLKYFTKELKNFAKSINAIYVRLDPNVIESTVNAKNEVTYSEYGLEAINNLKQEYHYYGPSIGYVDEQPRWNHVLALKDQDYKAIRKSYHSALRNEINYATKAGSQVREGSFEDLNEFYKILQHTSDRQNFSERSLEYFQQFYEVFVTKGLAKLLFVDVDLEAFKANVLKDIEKAERQIAKLSGREDKVNTLREVEISLKSYQTSLADIEQWINKYGTKVISATSIFVLVGNEVIYFHSGGYDDLMKLRGQKFLQDYMIQYAINNHYDYYNFFGITGDFENDGVYIFKKRFGGYAQSYIGQFDIPTMPLVYKTYQLASKVKQRLK